MAGITLTPRAFERVGNTVKTVEQQIQNATPSSRNPFAAYRENMVIVRVHNLTGETVAPGDALRLEYSYADATTALTEYRADPLIRADLPSPGQSDRLAIALCDMPDEGLGEACVAGQVAVYCDVIDADHKYVRWGDGEFVSSTSGYLILSWHDYDQGLEVVNTGEQWVSILLLPVFGTYTVAIIETIPPAVWDGTTLTPNTVTSPYFYPNTDGDGDIINAFYMTTYQARFKHEVSITAGKFKVGEVVNGRLMSVDCDEQDLPEGFGE